MNGCKMITRNDESYLGPDLNAEADGAHVSGLLLKNINMYV